MVLLALDMSEIEISGPMEVARERLGYEPPYVIGSMSDGHKLGVAVGSGGAAGPVSLGKLQALQEAGVLGVVDEIHAISVGAINASAQMAGQTELALEGYDVMTKHGFIRRSRVNRMLDMRILDGVLRGENGLNPEKITKSPVPVHVGVSRVNGGLRPISINLSEQDPEHVIDWIMRGAHLGIAAGPAPKDKLGNVYADGGFSHLSAVHMAVSNGCTDVIYLSNQPYEEDAYSVRNVLIFGGGFSLYDPLAILHLSRIVRAQIASRKDFKDGAFKYRHANVEAFFPPEPDCPENTLPTLFNTDPRKIKIGFDIGKLSVLQRLSGLLPIMPNTTAS